MIRIAKIPHIVEDTDRWGRPMGTFSVIDTQGEIDEQTWEKIKAFESYNISEKGKEELLSLESQMKSGVPFDKVKAPYMKELIGYPKSQIWQFSMYTGKQPSCIRSSGIEPHQIRSYAIFGAVTLHTWTPEHDSTVRTLEEQVNTMNGKK